MENLFGEYKNYDEWENDVFQDVTTSIKASNQIPSESDYLISYYDKKETLKTLGSKVLGIIQNIVDESLGKNFIRIDEEIDEDIADRFENLIDVNDNFLEIVDRQIDILKGVLKEDPVSISKNTMMVKLFSQKSFFFLKSKIKE